MLTDRQIKTAIKDTEPGAETILNDGAGGRGTGSLRLIIRATNAGATATWFATWKQDGQRAKKSLGRYPDLTLADARVRFGSDIRPVLLAGKNPRTKAAASGRATVRAMFEAYIADMKSKGRASAGEVERMLLLAPYNAADELGSAKHPGSIEPDDVVGYVAKFYAKGNRGAADKARAYVSAAFGWARKATHDYTSASRQDWGVKFNPAEAVKKDAGAIEHGERNLSASELRMVWGARLSPDVLAFIRLLICTGQRIQELMRVEACELDLAAGLWRMPTEKTKTKLRPHTVPLPPQAVEILRGMVERRPTGLLFPFSGHGVLRLAVKRWLDGVEMEHFSPRDLRRTWKSRTGELGIDRFTRDLIQQHAKGDTGSLNYDRADYLPQMREAMKRWGEWLDSEVLKE